jgi:hypothetical protein
MKQVLMNRIRRSVKEKYEEDEGDEEQKTFDDNEDEGKFVLCEPF